MYKKQKKSGFTLIELSIVLVIISLIVGGIIGGKALVKSAEIQNAIKKIGSITTAVNTFSLQYDALPGDMRDATDYWPGVTSDGDGNGYFESSDNILNREGGYIWHHLGLAEIYNPFNRPQTSGFSYEYGLTTPEILPDTAVVAQRRDIIDSSNRYDITRNYIQIGKWQDPGTASALLCAGVNTLTALAIDKKYDDGIASSGNAIAYVQSTCSTTTATCTDHSGGGLDYQQLPGTVDYDKGNPDGGCRMSFLIFND